MNKVKTNTDNVIKDRKIVSLLDDKITIYTAKQGGNIKGYTSILVS